MAKTPPLYWDLFMYTILIYLDSAKWSNQISLSSGYSRSASLLDSVKYHMHQLCHQYPALDSPTAGSYPSVPGIYL